MICPKKYEEKISFRGSVSPAAESRKPKTVLPESESSPRCTVYLYILLRNDPIANPTTAQVRHLSNDPTTDD